MRQNWQKLPLENHEGCPPLYVSYSTDSKGYEVFLTDLVYVWSESLNRKQILANAIEYETSIDPSQDDDQYNVLLQKIGDALNGKDKTTLSLCSRRNEDGLRLITKTKLTSPLDPLTWTIILSHLPQDAFSKHVFLPVLRGATTYEVRTQSLIEKLKEKDWALGKLFDKLESSGIDLSTVFPPLTGMRKHGRKGSAFSQASKLIKGVAPFDETSWNAEFTEQNSNDPVDECIIKAFSESDCTPGAATLKNEKDDWWTQICESQDAVTGAAPVRKAPSNTKPKQPAEEIPTESEDEFETRETPPGARKSSLHHDSMGNRTDKKTSHAPNEGESTESSEDEGNSTIQSPLPQRQRKQARALGTIGSKGSRDREHSVRQTSDSDVPVSSNKSKTKTKALGTIGGKKSRGSKVDEPLARGRSKTTESEEPTRKTPNPQPDDEPTASEEEEDIVSRPSKQHRSQQSDDEDTDRPVTPKKKDTAKARVGGLGQIGGKKRKETVEERNSNQDAEASRNRAESPPSTPNPAKRPNKLGMIGGGKLKRTEATSQSQTDKRPIAEEEDISTADEMPAQGERAQTEALNRVKESTRSASPPPKPQVRPRSLQKEGSKPAKEETPEERANRRREELRRELEAKSGPAKKKRRF